MALTPETRQIADELTKLFLVPFDIDENVKLIRDPAPFAP